MKEWIRIKDGWQTPVPDELLNSEISKGAKLLWICLKSFASKTSPQPFPGRYTISKMVGGKKPINKESFYSYRQELIDGGFLEPEKQLHRERGRWGSRCYTLGLPDGNCKQKSSSPCLVLPDTVGPDTAEPDTVKPDTKSTTNLKSTNSERNTTTTRAADAASVDVGSCFLKVWKMGFEQWFGQTYLQKSGEAKLATKIIKDLRCRPKDLAAYAYRMWINTTDYDEIDPNGFDPLFYQIKASRNLGFFLAHLSEIAVEQKEPLDAAIPVREPAFRQLEKVVAEGRPGPED